MVLIAGALSGAVLAGIVAVYKPRRYLASAVVRPPAARSIRDLNIVAMSRGSLAEVIQKERLYQPTRLRLPMEDVIEQMHRDIEFQCLDTTNLWAIRFAYEDAHKAQRAIRDLVAKMSVPGPAVVINVSSEGPQHPTRLEIAGLGFVGGFGVALLAVGLWRSSRMRLLMVAALAGGIVAGAIWFVLPKTYVSVGRLAVSSVPPLDRAAASNYWMSVSRIALGEISLARIANNPSLSLAISTNKSMPKLLQELRKRIDIKAVCSDEFSIMFSYNNPTKAQLINAHLITALTEEAVRLQRESVETPNQPSKKSALALDSPPIIREKQGQLRTAIEEIDVQGISGNANLRDASVALLLRHIASGTLERPQDSFGKLTTRLFQPSGMQKPQKALPPGLPTLQVIASASLPDAPMSPNRVVVTLVGIIVGLFVGMVLTLCGPLSKAS